MKPIPADAPNAPTNHPTHGQHVGEWIYRDGAGRPLFMIRRYHTQRGKVFAALMFDGEAWTWSSPPAPRPLFGLDWLTRSNRKNVVIVEGEKKAEALRRHSDQLSPIAWPFGANSVPKADWEPLRGAEDVVLWPDNDEPGRKAMDALSKILQGLGVKTIRRVRIPDGKPVSWDAVDALAERATDVLDLIINAETIHSGPTAAAESPVDPEPSGRPQIRIAAGELPRIVNELENALFAAFPEEIFQRCGRLVRIVRENSEVQKNGITYQDGRIAIVPMDLPTLHHLAAQSADFVKFNERAGKALPCDIDRKFLEIIMNRRGAFLQHVLTGISEVPVLRPNGSIAQTEGYDPETGLFLDFGGTKFPVIPESPTIDEAAAALGFVMQLLDEFPFCSIEDHSGALAAIMTGVIRPTLSTSPAFGFSSTTPGTGKTIMSDVVSIIASGRRSAMFPPARDDEEMRKRLFAAFMGATRVLTIDNVEGQLRSSALNVALTSPTMTERIMGGNVEVSEVSTRTLILATGNNLVIAGDMTRRFVMVEMDPQTERPETRTFKIRDLRKHVADKRPEIVAAILTILRAYHVAGRPCRAKPCGFSEWSEAVREPLLWLGSPDPWITTERNQDRDPVANSMGAFLAAWAAHPSLSGKWCTAAQIIATAKMETPPSELTPEDAALNEAVSALFDGKANARELGKRISKYHGRIFGGLRMENRKDTDAKIQKWRILTLPEAASRASA